MFSPTSTFWGGAQAIQNLVPTVSASSNHQWFVAKALPLLDAVERNLQFGNSWEYVNQVQNDPT